MIIHWFRRDLRITDNTALAAAANTGDDVLGVYIASRWQGSHSWTGPMRQEFLCGCLESLAANLEKIGGRLVIREGDQVEALLELAREVGAKAITFNRDPDPFGRQVEQMLLEKARNLEIRSFKDVCICERDEVLTSEGKPFRVFSPYSRAWSKRARPPVSGPLKRLTCRVNPPSLPLPHLSRWGLESSGQILEAGEKAARRRLTEFLAHGLEEYGKVRNIPAGQTTSRLSQDLRFGLLSIREVYERSRQRAETFPAQGRKNAQSFLSELIWREFYMAILWHFPAVLGQEFNPKFRSLSWPGRAADFERWLSAETGFPIVDAAMRQLSSTGFMHNRPRMIVAMFLTKDLLVDWRLGESAFMQKLVDGEIASNNGGWQWSAGTGADAAPYFRIQNPWTQTARFDPEGTYIKEWLPELRDVAPEKFSSPPPDGKPLAKGYPVPMLDHGEARQRALEFFNASSIG